MPDKNYIKKVYSFMENAYGQQGTVSRGAFRGSFDDFYNRISSDEKYADKIYGALSTAYGPKGVYKRDAFTLDTSSFRGRVLTPPPEQFPVAKDMLSFSGKYPKGEDPAAAVLQSASEIEVPEEEQPGYLQDIKAFEPAIQATEALNQAQRERGRKAGEQYLLNQQSAAPISMQPRTPEEIVQQQLTDPNVQYRNSLNVALEKIDEEDRNRLASQAVADELYKTPQGRLYYDFIRPVYKTALETGKNVGAFGARLFNADKTADKIVDYFDFDRLAREGNPSAALTTEPAKQQGKLGINNIVPRAVEAITNMGILMGGSVALGGGKAALLASSFTMQYEGYRNSAKQAGLTDAEADKYAITGAGLTSMLELVSPNQLILNGVTSSIGKKSVLRAIKDGVSVRSAIKTGVKAGFKEVGKDNVQELSQLIGDNITKYAFDTYVLNDPQFHQENILPSAREALETMVLTSLATGILSAPHLVAKNRVPSLERSAWATAAEDPQMIEDGLNKAVAEQQITQAKADQIKQSLTEYKELYDALSAKGFDKKTVERMSINALRAKKIDEQNKPLAGIPVLNIITAQDESTKAEIEKEILRAAAGEPEADYAKKGKDEKEETVSSITVQQPETIVRPQIITIGEQNISEPIKTEPDAIQEQSTDESVLRQEQPELGLQEVGSTYAQPEIVTAEGEQIQPETQEEIAQPQVAKPPSMTPERTKRDEAIAKLKTAYQALGNIGIISDPMRDLKRQQEFYGALKDYVKEELLYRANQIKGFAQQKKAQIKRVITKSLKEEGISVQDISMLNDAFEQAYAEAKKIPGLLPEETNDRISFKQYIKDRIKVREAGRRKGVKEGVDVAALRVKNVRAAILETLKDSKVNLSMLQKRRLLTILQNAATKKDNTKVISRAIDATTQMIWEAKNKQKIAKAKSLIKSFSKLKRSKSMVLQDVEWIKQLQLPTPSKVDDLDTYIDMLTDYTQSRRANELNPKYTKEEISEFVDQENVRIYKEKRASQQETLDELKEEGIIPDDVTLDEYIGMLDKEPGKVSEGISPKAELLKQELKNKLVQLKVFLKDWDQEFDKDEIELGEKLTSVEPSYLNAADLIRLNNVLNNIAEFGTLDAAGDIVTSYEAKKIVEALVASKEKVRELPDIKVLNKKNLTNFISALFYNDNAIANFRAVTIGAVERVLSPVKQKAQEVVKEFVALNKKNHIDGLANNKIHAFSYLNQYRGVENGEIADDLKRRVDELVDDAKYVFAEGMRIKGPEGNPNRIEATNRLIALQQLGLIYFTIQNEELEVKIKDNFDSENPIASLEKIENKLSQGEKAVYQFARDHYDELTDKLESRTRNYAGKQFQRERNYISLVPRRKRGVDKKEPELSADATEILTGMKSINAKPSSTTIAREKKKGENIYYDSDFFSSFINRYYTSLYTAEVLPELQTVAKTINNPDFEKFITGQFDEGFAKSGSENFEKFKSKLAEAINEEKYSPFFKKGKTNFIDNLVSKGVRLVLGNIWQGPKQYAPALLHNFFINDVNAVRYALSSRGKAHFPFLYNKEYAQARQAFLTHFSGVQRSAVGSVAYDKYIKRIGDDMAWWLHPLEWLENIRKVSSFVLEKADKAAQNDAYIASYITSLLRDKKIKSVGDFDIYEHAKHPDKKALAFAEQMASNINNESARAYRPEVLKDPVKARKLWLLQGFALNAYQNAMNKAKIIGDNRANNAEKKEAFYHFLGYLAELGSYQLVGRWVRNLQTAIAVALLSAVFGVETEEDEEAKKSRKEKEDIKMLANMGADIGMSGLDAPTQMGIKMLVNEGYNELAKMRTKTLKKEAKAKGEKFDPRGTSLSPYFKPFVGAEGPAGSVEFYTDFGQRAIDFMKEAANQEDESKKSEAQKETERLASNLNKYLGIPAIVLGSGDLMILNNKMQQVLKQKVVTDKKKPKSTSSSSRSGRSARSRTRNTYNR